MSLGSEHSEMCRGSTAMPESEFSPRATSKFIPSPCVSHQNLSSDQWWSLLFGLKYLQCLRRTAHISTERTHGQRTTAVSFIFQKRNSVVYQMDFQWGGKYWDGFLGISFLLEYFHLNAGTHSFIVSTHSVYRSLTIKEAVMCLLNCYNWKMNDFIHHWEPWNLSCLNMPLSSVSRHIR